MRITDIVTPQELDKILAEERCQVFELGHRDDLIKKFISSSGDRVSADYIMTIAKYVPDMYTASGMFRLLCLLDKYLEEKYVNSNSTTN